MDFHGMKRKDLQDLCKKHGIPANLKNSEMASRLASVFQKETVMEKKISPEDSVEAHGIKENVIVSGKGKKVTFSPEAEVCEFTRSVKKRRGKNARTRTQEPAQDLHQGGIELRRSTRRVAQGITVAGSSETDSNLRKGIFETEKECSEPDVTKAHKVPRRSKRICSGGSIQESCEVTDLKAVNKVGDKDISNEQKMVITNQDGSELEKVGRRSTRLKAKIVESCVGGETSGTLLPAKRSRRFVDTESEEVKLVKNDVFEVKEAEENHRKDEQDDSKVEKVPRRSKRFANNIEVQTNTQDQRRSTRLKTNAEKPSMGGGASDCRPICSAKESKKESKAKQSKGSAAVNSLEGEPVKNKTKRASVDCEVQEVSKVEKVIRRSKRLGNNVDVPLGDENVKAVKGDDLEVEKASKQSMQLEKGDEQPKSSSGNDGEGQAMRNSSKEYSVIDYGRDRASVDDVKKLNGNDEIQVRVRVTRNSSRHDSDKAPIVVEGNLVEKKTDETFDSLVNSPKRVSRRKKRDRSVEPGMDTETATAQRNLTPEKLLDKCAEFVQEEAGGSDVEARGSPKKSKTINEECINNKPQGMVEDLPSFSETKATDSVMLAENDLDSSLEKPVDSSQGTNNQELNSELVEGEREEKLERDTDLMAVIEEEKEEVESRSVLFLERLSPVSVQLEEAEHVEDIASTAIGEESTKTKDEALVCTVSKLAKVEAVLKQSAECGKDIHSSKDDEKGSLEKDLQAATVHGNFINYNTENRSAEDKMEITKVGCTLSCVNLTPEKLLDACTQLELEEKGDPNVEATCSSKMKTVNQECVKAKPQGMSEGSPFTSETKATESIMISKNILGFTPKSSVDISARRNTQELNSELVKGEREEKYEQETIQMDAIKDNEEVSSPEAEPFVETTSPPASVDFAMSNPEAELDISTGHNLVKDVASEVIAVEDNKTKEDVLISVPKSEVKEHSFVAKLAEEEAILKNSAECWKEIHSSKDDEKSSMENEIQASNRHGCFSEYYTENSSAKEQAEINKVGHCVNVETLDEVKDGNLEKSERTSSCERGYKLNASEASGWSTGFASLSPEETDVPESFEEGEIKALSQPPIQKASSSDLDESALFTTLERNLMLMEQISENGKTFAANSVTHRSDKAVESPEQVLLLGDSRLDEAGKEKEHTTTDFPEEHAVHNTTEIYLMMGGSRQNKATNDGESVVAGLHEVSDIATTSVKQSSVGNFKGEGENITVELHCESGAYTSPHRHSSLGNTVSDKAESNGGNKAMEFDKESVVHTSFERRELFGCFGEDKAREREEQKAERFNEESGLFTGLHKDQPLADSELGEAGWREIDGTNKYGDSEQKKAIETGEKAAVEFHDESAVVIIPEEAHPLTKDSESDEAVKSEAEKAVELEVGSSIFTSAEKLLLQEDHPLADSELGEAGWQEIDRVNKCGGDSEQKKAKVIGEKAATEFHDVPYIPETHPFPEDSESDEAVKSEAKKAVELEVDCSIFTSAEKCLLLDTDEGMKGDNPTAKSHVVSCAFITPESQSLMGDSEPDETEKKYSENKDVELLSESSIFTNLESHLLSEDSEQVGKRKIRDKTASNCKESSIFTSVERRQLLGNSEPRNAGKQEQKEMEYEEESAFFSMQESRLLLGASEHDQLDIGKSDLSQCQIGHSSSPKFNSKDNNVVGGSHAAALDSRENIIVDSYARTASKVSQSENVAGLDAIQGTLKQSRGRNSPRVASVNLSPFDTEEAETILEEESDFSYVLALPAKGYYETDGETPSHLKVTSMVSEESSPLTDIKKQINDELEEVSITDHNGADELMKSTQKGCEGKTCVLAETEDGHSPIPTANDSTLREKAISTTPDESTVLNYMNEIAADGAMVRREATPSPEETLNESSEKREETLNVDESGMLTEREVRREPNLIFRTQVKPKRHDTKENAQTSKIVHNLNVTAPKTSKRKPLQDLRKN